MDFFIAADIQGVAVRATCQHQNGAEIVAVALSLQYRCEVRIMQGADVICIYNSGCRSLGIPASKPL